MQQNIEYYIINYIQQERYNNKFFIADNCPYVHI